MTQLAVTVIGDDRPGIVAAVTDVLAQVGGNVEDASMTILRGHFAMMLVLGCPAPITSVELALAPIAERLGLVVAIRELTDVAQLASPGAHYVVTVHGADRPGIVAAISGCVARHRGNVTDLTTRLAGELYVLTLELDLAGEVDQFAAELQLVAAELGVDAGVHAVEADLL